MREIISFRKAKDKITDAIKDFKKDPITNLGIIFPVLTGVVAGIGFVIALIMFIQNGGFTTQIDTIKDGNIYGEGSGFTTGIVSVLVMLLIAIVLLFFSECRELLKYTCVSGAISFGGFPLLLLLIENVIPLISNIVFLILFGVFMCAIFYSLGSESGGSYDSVGSSWGYQRSESSSNRRAVAATKKVSAPAKKESNQPIVKNCSGDVKIYRKECTSGWDGWGMIVFAENPYGATTRLCSYEEFKTGKVQINLNGKRVTQIAEVVK